MTTTFADLGVDPALVDTLAERGITSPFPIQTLTIPDALAGRDVLGKAKTGSGKTLAFGLPLLQRLETARPKRPRAICLVPTRELATQVRDELAPLGEGTDVRVTAIYGGAPIEKQISTLNRGVELVVATPGRAIDLIDRDALDLSEVTHIVIDEADRMADMGFLPQVEWILRNVEGKCQTLLFSATLDGVVNTLVSRYQENPSFHEVASKGQTVAEMHHAFLKVHDRDKPKVAAAIIQGTGRTLVFCSTKHGTDRVAQELNDLGVNAEAMHGGVPQKHREKALSNFMKGKLDAMVATDVAARGIHVDDVEVVIHFDPPADHKTYLHRSGRTARAGASGHVVSLVLWKDELEVRRIQRRLGLELPMYRGVLQRLQAGKPRRAFDELDVGKSSERVVRPGRALAGTDRLGLSGRRGRPLGCRGHPGASRPGAIGPARVVRRRRSPVGRFGQCPRSSGRGADL
jgi:superfamily II DNA/RNA helicase